MQHDAAMPQTPKNLAGKQKTPRLTVSLSRPIYKSVLQIAKAKKVSCSWVVRDAVEAYAALHGKDQPV